MLLGILLLKVKENDLLHELEFLLELLCQDRVCARTTFRGLALHYNRIFLSTLECIRQLQILRSVIII